MSFPVLSSLILISDTHHPPCQTRSMGLSRMNIVEMQALLRLLAGWERQELALLMPERREAERQGLLH